MKLQIATIPYVVKEEKSERKVLTSEEKFANLKDSEFKLGGKNKFRRFHFKLISMGEKSVLFNGLGDNFGEFNSDISGIRKARVFANNLFTKANAALANGGFLFDLIGFINPEHQDLEELERVSQITQRHLNYVPIRQITCNDCKLQFDVIGSIELHTHNCIVGKTWIIVLKKGETIRHYNRRKIA